MHAAARLASHLSADQASKEGDIFSSQSRLVFHIVASIGFLSGHTASTVVAGEGHQPPCSWCSAVRCYVVRLVRVFVFELAEVSGAFREAILREIFGPVLPAAGSTRSGARLPDSGLNIRTLPLTASADP